MKKLAAKVRLYAEINSEFDKDASWIAGIILDQSTQPATRLRNMLAHLKAGRVFSPLSFQMPSVGFFVDGVAVRPQFLLEKDAQPENFRLEV